MKQAEIAARLRYEIEEARLKRNEANAQASKLVGLGDTRGAQRLILAKAFWEGFEEGLKRSLGLVREKRNQRIVESAARP